MHTKQHRTSFPTLHRASTSPPVQSYHLPEHKACNRTQSFNNLSGNLLIKNSHPRQSPVLLLLRAQRFCFPEHRASPPREHSAYLHHTQYTGLMLSSGMLPPTKPHTPSKALCFFIPLSQNYHLTEISPSGTQSL